MALTHVDLPGNHRPAKTDATRVGAADPNQPVEVTVVVKGKQSLPEPDPRVAPMSIAEIEEKFGANQRDLDTVGKSLGAYGLKVTEASPGSRTLKVAGTVAQMEKAFSVELGEYKSAKGRTYRGRQGDIRVPAELSGIVEAVLGLDERQVARRRPVIDRENAAPPVADAQSPSTLAARYQFPDGDAAGQKVGILEFGGGYFASDLTAYCQQVSQTATPTVNVVSVGLKSLTLQEIQQIADQQQQDDELDASGEVNMDVQVVAGLCPGAELFVYFAPFSQKGWVDVLTKAIHTPDGPTVISVSWGNPEDADGFSAAAIQAINKVLQTAALAGITICVSSGDDGAGDAVNDGKAHCDFPSTSPYVLAVGGTMFPNGEAEQGWWDTPGARTGNGGGSSTGGRSTVFPTPSWQNVDVVSVRTGQASGRCVPDVSALAGNPLYDLVFVGQRSPNGGTSASAPLWAALIARIAANLPAGQKVGFLTPQLYNAGSDGKPLGVSVTTDITVGKNEVDAFTDDSTNPPQVFKAVTGYTAGPGYDAVTGWGVPNGKALQAALSTPLTVADSLFKSLPKGAGGPKTAIHTHVTHDPYAALIIDHDLLNSIAGKQSTADPSNRGKVWTDIPFPDGTLPTVLADSSKASLPQADVVLITYTSDEANAMAAVLTPGFVAIPPSKSSTPGWTSYTHLYSTYIPDLLHGSSPALDSHNLGLYKLVQIGSKKVLCFKSSLHLARDGKSIPVMRLVQQIYAETGASLIITTGTAGGIGASVQLGDAAIVNGCTFDLVRMFASEPYNKTTIQSTFQLKDPSFLGIATNKLIPVNAGRLNSSPIPPKRTPTIVTGSEVFGNEPNLCVTTDGFLYDDAQNTYHLQGMGCMVEMDDAVVGLAVQEISGSRPDWLAIRNASDPQMPAGATKQESSNIYLEYGFYTTFSSVLACWACILGS